MEKKIEIVCRLCAKTERGSTNIFSKAGKEKNLPVVIEKLTGIVVSVKDALPKTVCRACQKQLLQYVNFKNRCLQVQATLRNVTVKRCKELSPQPTKKRILSENPPSKSSRSKMAFSGDQHEKQVAKFIKEGFYLKAVFTPPKIGSTEISRSRFKQYKNPTLISQINVLGCFVNFLVIFRYIWEEIVFLKRVVKFGEIRNS